MNPQSGHSPSSSKCSDQVTPSTGPELISRAAVPLVPVLRVEGSGEECARPATDDNGFEPSRLLLKRLEVLAAALQQVKELQRMAAEAPQELQMRDFSTGLLINILRETVDHVQHSAEIDQASPGVKDLKRALLGQILRLLASEPELARLATQELPQGVRNGIQ